MTGLGSSLAPLLANKHAVLQGAKERFRFRSDRIDSKSLSQDWHCNFPDYGYCAKIDNFSSTGVGLLGEELKAFKEDNTYKIEIICNKQSVWFGEATLVSVTAKTSKFGFRFVGAHLNIQEILFRDEFLGYRFEHFLKDWESEFAALPSAWLANAMKMYTLLLEIHKLFDAYEASDANEAWGDPLIARQLCSAAYDSWAPSFLSLAEEMEEASKDFDLDLVKLGHQCIQKLFMTELSHGEIQRRAYEKPQGYAGDFRMMELVQQDELIGETLFEMFLQYLSQNMALGQTVRARSDVAYTALKEVIAKPRPTRIVSLASGPAMELRRLLQSIATLDHKVEIFLVDQDEEALRNGLSALNKIYVERGDNLPIEFHCLHFSLRQLIAPKKGAESELVHNVLHNVDLVYSMGLFDYLPQKLGQRAVNQLFNLTNPGGKLLIGNLARSKGSSWLIEYATAWHLIYRNNKQMLNLAKGIKSAQTSIVKDKTGGCFFLQAIR
jgi:SAM-dependent methyltransferase|tara:strand:+ start:304 stop:1788 length:1485 start_codon:yes stop_codon:yes gene_type:complete